MKKIVLLSILVLLTRCSPDLANASEVLTVTVVSPQLEQAISQISPGGYTIGFRLICVNAATDTVIDKIVTANFNQGDSPTQFRLRTGYDRLISGDAHDIQLSSLYSYSGHIGGWA